MSMLNNTSEYIDAEFKSDEPGTAIEPVASAAASEVVVLENDESKNDASLSSDDNNKGINLKGITIGADDINNDKSTAEGMKVSGGKVNMTITNNNSKVINKNRFAEAANMSVPTSETGEKSLER